MQYNNLHEALEHLIDNHGLDVVLTELVSICEEKAEHVRANWQDNPLAVTWEKRANKLDKVRSWIDSTPRY